MPKLKDTAIRVLSENKKGILEDLSEDPKRQFAIELFAEEGEILITLLMTKEEIEACVKEAVKEVFQDKKAYNIYNVEKLIYFKLK